MQTRLSRLLNMIIVHAVFSCVACIHIYFTLRQHLIYYFDDEICDKYKLRKYFEIPVLPTFCGVCTFLSAINILNNLLRHG